MGRIENKVAVITGGAGGIGSEVARRFVDEGALVLLVDLDEDALTQVCSELPSNRVSYLTADVTSWADTPSCNGDL